MAKKHVGIGIAAIAAGAGAATYMKKKSQKKQKKAQMDARYQDYRNTERGKQVKNKKGIYYSNGNYEAFARPEKPEGVEEKSAYIVGSGLASLAAACFLVRDGQMPGDHIHILEAMDIAGGACDGIFDPTRGYVMRGGREMENHFECLWDLFRSIPSLEVPNASVLDEFYWLNKHHPPIRAELLQGDRLAGLQYTNLSAAKPIILVIGGSLGSVKVNGAVRSILPKLLEQFQVIHICGKGNLDESLIGTSGYVQYEYVDSPLKHLFAAADLIVSRAGANSICEILALRKPNVLIPLSAAASRGDQILNANSFAKQGYSTVLEEEKVTDDTLFDAIHDTYENRRTFIENMEKSHLNNAIDTIMKLINDCANHK